MIRLKVWIEYENYLSALLWFVKTMKCGKSEPGKYYYFLLRNNSIRVGAEYSTTCMK